MSAANNSNNGPTDSLPLINSVSTKSGENDLREVETESTHNVQITRYEDSVKAIDDVAPSLMPDHLWSGSNTLPDQGLKEVLSRSYQLDTFTWNSSPMGTDLVANMDVLEELLSVPQIVDKIKYFRYFRCKGVNVTVRINCTPWHYGCLVLSSTVNNSQAFHNNTSTNAAQYMNNRPVLLDASGMQAADYKIMWKDYRQWTTTKRGSNKQLMTFRMTVAVPLSMIGDSLIPARVSLYANFIEPEVAFPVDDVAFNSSIIFQSQSRKIKQSEEALDKSKNNSIMSSISSFADTAFDIVGSISEVAAKVAPLAALVADKPTTLRPMDRVMVFPGTDMPLTDGLDTGPKLAASPAANAGFQSGVIGEAIDNPSVYSLVRTPGFIGSQYFTSATAIGDRLDLIELCPRGQGYIVDVGDDTYITPTPLSWYSPLFRFWRGGLKIMFHFVTSAFITARLRFVWFPPSSTPPLTLTNYNTTGNYISEVVEVTGCMDHVITIPYISPTLYKQVANADDKTIWELLANQSGFSEDSGLGKLAIYLITPIVSVDSSIEPRITWIKYISAAEDFQFNSFAGQVFDDPDAMSYSFGTPNLSFQSQTSVFETFESPFRSIVDATVALERGLATAEEYNDLASLCKRYSVIEMYPSEASSTDYSATTTWSNFLFADGATDVKHFQQWITACFVNFRGSMRHKYVWREASDTGGYPTVVGAVIPNSAIPPRTQWFTFAPTIVSSMKMNNFFEFEIPYNTTIPFLTRELATGNLEEYGLNASLQLPVTDASVLTQVGVHAMAVGDDFAFGVYQAPPLVSIRFTPPPGKSLSDKSNNLPRIKQK